MDKRFGTLTLQLSIIFTFFTTTIPMPYTRTNAHNFLTVFYYYYFVATL